MTTLSIADARANLSKIIDSAVKTHERIEVTRNGDRVAVILSADDHDSLIETVDILSSGIELELIREGLQDFNEGNTFTLDNVREEMATRKRASA